MQLSMNQMQPERESQTVKRLRQQVHRSFLQINEMEKLYHMEMEHTKQEFEERERAIKQKEEDIKQKYVNLESNLRLKESFIVDVGDFDISLDEIAYRKEDTMRDSGIQNIKELLAQEQRNGGNDFQAKLAKLREIQNAVLGCVPSPPSVLFQLFQTSNQLCLENCRLKEELLNYQETTEVHKTQILEGERIIEKLRLSENRLKKQNQQLNQLYIQEASMNAEVEEGIKVAREEINQKNLEIGELREQFDKLTQTFKITTRIDMSKLNLNSKPPFVTKSKTDDNLMPTRPVEKPTSLRMSSGAILLRNINMKESKPMTPQAQSTFQNDSMSPRPRPSFDFGGKFMKKKPEKQEGR